MVRKTHRKSHTTSRSSNRLHPSNKPQSQADHRRARLVAHGNHTTELQLDFDGCEIGIRLAKENRSIIDGPISVRLICNGSSVELSAGWTMTRWNSTQQADFIELQQIVSGIGAICRRVVLAKEDEILFVSDLVSVREGDKASYRLQLPLDPQTKPQGKQETREIVLTRGRQSIQLLPIGLPEWQCQPVANSLSLSGRHLNFNLSARGGAMYLPLCLDLNPRRSGKFVTWRKLTVAEQLKTVADHVAVGYRLQLGSRQWLVYQSLGTSGNRSVLGQNLVDDFLLASFGEMGKITDVVRIPQSPHQVLDQRFSNSSQSRGTESCG